MYIIQITAADQIYFGVDRRLGEYFFHRKLYSTRWWFNECEKCGKRHV